MKNKKNILIALVLLVVIVGIAYVVLGSNKTQSKGILISQENEVIEEISETENQLVMANTALTFTDKGFLKLYDIETGEMVSILDLETTYFTDIEEVDETQAEDEAIVEVLENVKNEEVEEVEEIVDTEIAVKEEIDTAVEKSHSYKYIKNGSNEFDIFYEETTNKLFSLTVEDKTLYSAFLFEDTDVSNINSIWANDDFVFLSHNDSNIVTKVTLSSKDKEIITLKGVPTSLTIKDNTIYYTFLDNLSKLNLVSKQETTVLLGDISNDVFFVEEELYAINHFGSGKSNSLLMKINPENLKVDKIIELKGAKSELIGINDESSIVYVMQNDEDYNVKSIDLIEMKPLHRLRIEKNRRFKSYDDAVYYQKENKLICRSLMTNEIIKEIDIEGNLVVVK